MRQRKAQRRLSDSSSNFNDTVRSHAFIKWQSGLLQRLYSNHNLVVLNGVQYPAIAMAGDPTLTYPFRTLCSKNDLTITASGSIRPALKPQLDYWALVSEKVKYPDQLGYGMLGYRFNERGQIVAVSAQTGTYKQNIIDSHYLQYELFQAYSSKSSFEKLGSASREVALTLLPARKRIHDQNGNDPILHNQMDRFSLLGVQAVFAYKTEETYRVRVIKRSLKTAIRPGYYQLIPAGNFEVFEKSANTHQLREGFDPNLALLRELLEEVFGVEEFQFDSNEESAFTKIGDHPISQKLEILLKEKTASVMFLGSVADLTLLRHELCFFILIDDMTSLMDEFKAGRTFEGAKEDLRVEDFNRRCEDEEHYPLNPGTAGLWKLAQTHPEVSSIANRRLG